MIDTSEFGVALVMLADCLAENEMAIPPELHQDFERLALQMGNAERVMGPLSLCLSEDDDS